MQGQCEGARKVGSIAFPKHSLLFKHGDTEVHEVRNGHVCHCMRTVGWDVAYGYVTFSGCLDGKVIEACTGLAKELDRVRELRKGIFGNLHLLGYNDLLTLY